MNKIDDITLRRLVSTGSDIDFQEFSNFMNDLFVLVNIQTGIVVPTYQSNFGANYLDTATNKFYRNVDGGTTWVALN